MQPAQCPQSRGSSPRVRGTGPAECRGRLPRRFIPAGAGNSGAGKLPSGRGAVHPRGCGEQATSPVAGLPVTGSSPRVRGTVVGTSRSVDFKRFIPAGAGNRSSPVPARCGGAVHPRGCGEQLVCVTSRRTSSGSSPRVRGTAPQLAQLQDGVRFIPAGAGNRPWSAACRRRHSVHPRGCGEQVSVVVPTACTDGSSPRVRGTGQRRPAVELELRFIPAGAGNRSPGRRPSGRNTVHPRGCGEQIMSPRARPTPVGSSPRVRGTGADGRLAQQGARFIPAGAGNRGRGRCSTCWPPVHPRGCGEQCYYEPAGAYADGSSPRVRGTEHRRA